MSYPPQTNKLKRLRNYKRLKRLRIITNQQINPTSLVVVYLCIWSGDGRVLLFSFFFFWCLCGESSGNEYGSIECVYNTFGILWRVSNEQEQVHVYEN